MLSTSLTLPYLWFIVPPYVDAADYIVIGEILVFPAKAAVLNRILRLKPAVALVCLFVMNLTSFLPGQVLLKAGLFRDDPAEKIPCRIPPPIIFYSSDAPVSLVQFRTHSPS